MTSSPPRAASALDTGATDPSFATVVHPLRSVFHCAFFAVSILNAPVGVHIGVPTPKYSSFETGATDARTMSVS